MTKYKLHTQEIEINEDIIGKHKDFKKLMHQYQKATKPLYLTPLYKDKKAFLTILLIVLLAYIIAQFNRVQEEDLEKNSTEQVISK